MGALFLKIKIKYHSYFERLMVWHESGLIPHEKVLKTMRGGGCFWPKFTKI